MQCQVPAFRLNCHLNRTGPPGHLEYTYLSFNHSFFNCHLTANESQQSEQFKAQRCQPMSPLPIAFAAQGRFAVRGHGKVSQSNPSHLQVAVTCRVAQKFRLQRSADSNSIGHAVRCAVGVSRHIAQKNQAGFVLQGRFFVEKIPCGAKSFTKFTPQHQKKC